MSPYQTPMARIYQRGDSGIAICAHKVRQEKHAPQW